MDKQRGRWRGYIWPMLPSCFARAFAFAFAFAFLYNVICKLRGLNFLLGRLVII